MKIRIVLLFAILTLQSCMSGSNDTVANDKIDSKLREIIKSKNDSLMDAMSNSDLKAYKALASEKFVKHIQSKTSNFVWLYRKGYLDNKYAIFDEYYNVSSKPLTQIKIESEKNGYNFSYVNEQNETYVSLLKASLYQNDYLLIVTYSLTDTGWRITDIEATMFGHYGKNAKEYYEMAKKSEKDGFQIDAFLYADMAVISMQESESMLKFNDEKEMKSFNIDLLNKINKKYQFPHIIEDIDSKPEILKIQNHLTKEGMYPLISYKTTIPLRDIEKLKNEYEQIKTKIRTIYTDMDFNRPVVLYSLYNTNDPKVFHAFEDRKEK